MIKGLQDSIDLRGWFCQTWMLKSKIQKVQPTGDWSDSAQQAALRAPLWYSRENAAFCFLPRFRGRTGTAAPVLWARVCPPGPLSPDTYKYPHGVLQKGICKELG